MSHKLYAVEEVAERLGLHVRTVRAYIREGRLKATRIGKAYRISHGDLADFLGPAAAGLAPGGTHAEVSGIVEVEGLDPDGAMGLTNLIVAAANTGSGQSRPLRVETLYDVERARLKVIVVGGLNDSADLLKLIAVWTEQKR